MATDLFEGVFNQILLKTAKNFFNFVPLPPPHFVDIWIFINFPPVSYLSNLDQQKIGWFWFILSRVMLKKPLEVIPTTYPFVQELLKLVC